MLRLTRRFFLKILGTTAVVSKTGLPTVAKASPEPTTVPQNILYTGDGVSTSNVPGDKVGIVLKSDKGRRGQPVEVRTTSHFVEEFGEPWYMRDKSGYSALMYLSQSREPLVVVNSSLEDSRPYFDLLMKEDCLFVLGGDSPSQQYVKHIVDSVNVSQDRIAIISGCDSDFPKDIVAFTKQFDSSYTACYAPSVKVFDPFMSLQVFAPLDGFIAAKIINERNSFLHAGFSRGHLPVLDVRYRYRMGEMDVLHENGINPLRFVPGKGVAIWGDRTLTKEQSVFQSLSARLVFLDIRKSFAQIVKSYDEHKFDDFTTELIKGDLISYLEMLKSKRALHEYSVTSVEKGWKIQVHPTRFKDAWELKLQWV